MARLLFVLVVLTGCFSGFFYLASCTDYFNKDRVKKLARNTALLAAGFFIALLGLLLTLAATGGL